MVGVRPTAQAPAMQQERFDAPEGQGWYPDPWELAKERWYDGSQWTGYMRHAPPMQDRIWPRSRAHWTTFVVSAVVGLAVWVPVALQPREQLMWTQPKSEIPASWFPMMLLAPIVLGFVFSRSWPIVPTGLLLPQFVLAPWTTPRGDNDGLWVLIFPTLAVLFGYALVAASGSAWVSRRLRR
jgi:hypothetical protein